MPISIHSVTTVEECRLIEKLHLDIWGSDEIDVVPDHLMLTIAKNGGIVLLAWLNEQPVGFAFCFQGQTKTGIRKQCSHQVGVLPDKSRQGIGYQLKLAQREATLTQNLDLITWTFDPLLSLNAYFNFYKLGVISQMYYRNVYGTMRSNINSGLESDRLQVEWWLNHPQVIQKLNQTYQPRVVEPTLILNRSISNQNGYLEPNQRFLTLNQPRHFIQIPDNIDAIKQADLPLAIAWREQNRYLFETAFAEGYIVTDFIHQKGQGFYLIQKNNFNNETGQPHY